MTLAVTTGAAGVRQSEGLIHLPIKNRIEELLQEALQHRAVRHPYLDALVAGPLPNPRKALEDFAAQYYAYSSWFPRYLTVTISKLESAKSRQHLIQNLAEESGALDEHMEEVLKLNGIDPEWVRGVPHPVLFRQFREAMGVNDAQTQFCDAVRIWRDLFYGYLLSASAEEVVGALGLGTESIVKHIYRPIIAALQEHTELTRQQYVFFELHCEVDDEHGALLLQIAEELSSDEEKFQRLRMGMHKALFLRAAFWDAMWERARSLK